VGSPSDESGVIWHRQTLRFTATQGSQVLLIYDEGSPRRHPVAARFLSPLTHSAHSPPHQLPILSSADWAWGPSDQTSYLSGLCSPGQR
jgi:hypothetical protein